MKYYPNYLSADDMPENDEEIKENPATEGDNDEDDPENEEGLEPYDDEEDEE